MPPQQHKIAQEARLSNSSLGIGKTSKNYWGERRKTKKGNEEWGKKQSVALNENIKEDDDNDALPSYNRDDDSKRFLIERKIFDEIFSNRIERIKRIISKLILIIYFTNKSLMIHMILELLPIQKNFLME